MNIYIYYITDAEALKPEDSVKGIWEINILNWLQELYLPLSEAIMYLFFLTGIDYFSHPMNGLFLFCIYLRRCRSHPKRKVSGEYVLHA